MSTFLIRSAISQNTLIKKIKCFTSSSGRSLFIIKLCIEMYLKEIIINMKNWVDSAQDRDYSRALVNAALNLRIP